MKFLRQAIVGAIVLAAVGALFALGAALTMPQVQP